VEEGMGLQNIRQRTLDIRGTLSIESQPNGGTVIIINIPYEETRQFLASEVVTDN
jgi:signal transduction histidine kinase